MLNEFGPRDPFARNPLYPKPSFTHVLRLTFTLVVWIGFAPSTGLTQEIDPEVARFVGEVAAGVEYHEGNQATVQWTKPPRLSLFNADAKQTRIVDECIQKINRALATTSMRIEKAQPNDETASLRVYFAPLKRFQKIADQNDINYVQGNWGYFYLKWNNDYEIKQGIVLLASDRLRGDRLKHFALEEITQSLGLAGDSGRFKDSVFYENQAERELGTATEFNELDVRLMRFFYNRVTPGLHAVELGILMSEHWDR